MKHFLNAASVQNALKRFSVVRIPKKWNPTCAVLVVCITPSENSTLIAAKNYVKLPELHFRTGFILESSICQISNI